MKIESFIVFHNGAVVPESSRIDIDEAVKFFNKYLKSIAKKSIIILYCLDTHDELSILLEQNIK